MGDSPNYSTGGWGEFSNCQVEDIEDTSFIRPPVDEIEKSLWISVCQKCPVNRECGRWADRLKVSGVWAAGRWHGELE